MSKRTFRVMVAHTDAAKLTHIAVPRSVPWDWLAQYEDSMQRNHGQTMERLAQRGGLFPCEIMGVVTANRSWWRGSTEEQAIQEIAKHVEAWECTEGETGRLRAELDRIHREVDAACELGGEAALKLMRVLAVLKGYNFSEENSDA